MRTEPSVNVSGRVSPQLIYKAFNCGIGYVPVADSLHEGIVALSKQLSGGLCAVHPICVIVGRCAVPTPIRPRWIGV